MYLPIYLKNSLSLQFILFKLYYIYRHIKLLHFSSKLHIFTIMLLSTCYHQSSLFYCYNALCLEVFCASQSSLFLSYLSPEEISLFSRIKKKNTWITIDAYKLMTISYAYLFESLFIPQKQRLPILLRGPFTDSDHILHHQGIGATAKGPVCWRLWSLTIVSNSKNQLQKASKHIWLVWDLKATT